MLPLRFEPYHLLAGTPHVIVDGSESEGTRLTLSHWPGSPTPRQVWGDLSAQIAFSALDHPDWFDGIEIVSNNHFDQDGLCSVWTLIDPSAAGLRRDRVVDLARAGDFATWRSRDSARLSMAIAAYADPERSPLGADAFAVTADEKTALLYRTLLPLLGDLIDRPESVEALWSDEDAHVQAGLDAIAAGNVSIEEHPELDLAVVTIPPAWPERTVHRFTMSRAEAAHPMAVNNATDCMVLMLVQGDRVRIEQRYETWVIYPSRPLRPRQDLRALAAALTADEPGTARWHADPPSTLTPHLTVASGVSALSAGQVREVATHFLVTAPPAWNPSNPSE